MIVFRILQILETPVVSILYSLQHEKLLKMEHGGLQAVVIAVFDDLFPYLFPDF